MSDRIPVIGHPSRLVLIRERKAQRLVKDGKAQLIDGVLYWFKVPRRRTAQTVPRSTWFDRNQRDRESIVKKWKTAMSAEPGEGGPLVRQAVTSEAQNLANLSRPCNR